MACVSTTAWREPEVFDSTSPRATEATCNEVSPRRTIGPWAGRPPQGLPYPEGRGRRRHRPCAPSCDRTPVPPRAGRGRLAGRPPRVPPGPALRGRRPSPLGFCLPADIQALLEQGSGLGQVSPSERGVSERAKRHGGGLLGSQFSSERQALLEVCLGGIQLIVLVRNEPQALQIPDQEEQVAQLAVDGRGLLI